MEQTGPLLRLYFYTLSLTFKALDYKDKIFPKYTTLNVQEKSVGFDSSIQSICACFYVIFFFLLTTIFPQKLAGCVLGSREKNENVL
ncbi:hypothetical protein P3535_23130 [Vibrio parahaemolyticus]|nr:hypothetical protein [Vibrio parahaemolyticus]